jgi:hypothetical protein
MIPDDGGSTHYNPEDSSEHHTRRRENLKSHMAWIDLISEMVLIKLHKWRLIYKSLRDKNTKERNKQGAENGTVVELTGMASLAAVGACELSHCKTRGLWKSEINYRTVLLNLEKNYDKMLQ